ncbi:MAG: PhoH-like protein [Alphaproteobacteria bacterium ADurb.BinA280]|nr:MAG: PhoH-like protein [Alphaproteobacteria bacterium ADurb.BinA280]
MLATNEFRRVSTRRFAPCDTGHWRAVGIAGYPRAPMSKPHRTDFTFEPDDSERLSNLVGPLDEHLRQIELRLGVEIANRGNVFRVSGEERPVQLASRLLHRLYALTEDNTLTAAQINLHLQESGIEAIIDEDASSAQEVTVKVKRGTIRGRGPNQARYLHAIATHDINFGIGPAGTGKTYLAVAMAVDALNGNRAQRLILVRPAVEAGEKLGFLPGDLTQKVDPYLRPLYDALYEMLGIERVTKLIERNVIEIAPLAYMRGRTLNDSFVILDEAQNTTIEQMKMFLTRIGFGSIAVVTGDVTQTDLPKHVKSGLRDATEVLRDVEGISFTFFNSRDVVRHPLVQRIVRAYEAREDAQENNKGSTP